MFIAPGLRLLIRQLTGAAPGLQLKKASAGL
jgi:hypothetical protein